MKRKVLFIGGLLAVCGSPVLAQPKQQVMRPVLNEAAEPIEFAPITVCFAQGTDLNYVNRIETMVNQMNLLRFGAPDYQLTSRWPGSQGTPRALTWSFAPDGVSIPGGAGEATSNNVLFSSMDSAFASQGGRATWTGRFTQVFARWQALSGLTYTRITTGGNDWDDGAAWGSGGGATRGDLRIGAHPIDGVSGVLAFNQFPTNGDMVLDSADGPNWASTSNSNRFLRNVIAHEHGHGMGLLHVCPASGSKLMEPFISTGYDGPQQDDIRAAQRHYGDPYESNDVAATAKPMGALSIPGTLPFGSIPSPAVSGAALLSIDADAKVDFWSFTVSAATLVNCTVTPVGTTYLQGTQTSQCNTGTNVNALAIADLAVTIYDTNGTTVLGTSSSAAVGTPEVLSNVGLPGPGTYFVRVSETNSPAESQLYQISLTATSPPVCPQITQQPLPIQTCEDYNVSLTVAASGNPAPTYQWRRNLVAVPGATSATYNLIMIQANQAGSYDCVVTNACGGVNSDAVVVDVVVAPVYTQQPSNQSVAPGSPASFTVAVQPSPDLVLQWRKDTNPILGANAATYSIASVSLGDAGTYDCLSTNLCGETLSNPATLTVEGTACYANCDGSAGSPLLTANDFTCFVNAFATGEAYANCDGSAGSPILTANDFTCFVNAFALGCP